MPDSLTIFLINLFFIYSIQSLSYILGIYALIGLNIDRKRYLIGSALVLVTTILIRNLPIERGVHTILVLVLITLVTTFYLKFPVYAAVKASLTLMIVLLLIEILNLFIYKLILPTELYEELINNNGIITAVSGIPVNILFFVIMFIIYRYTTKHHMSFIGDYKHSNDTANDNCNSDNNQDNSENS